MPVPTWTEIARQPLVRSLVLSISIHLALLAFVQPWTGRDGPHTLVINARLQPYHAIEQPEVAVTAPLPGQQEVTESPPVPAVELDPLSVPKPASIQATAAAPAPAQPSPQQDEVMARPSEVIHSASHGENVAPTSTSPPPQLAISSPIDTTWYLARQVDRHPKAIGSISPQYPEMARQRGQEGSLKLMVKIDDLGRVREVEVVEATPPGVFDEAALEAFRNASFQPAMKDGRPVRYEAYMRVEFRLE